MNAPVGVLTRWEWASFWSGERGLVFSLCSAYAGLIIKSYARLTSMQLKKKAKLFIIIGCT